MNNSDKLVVNLVDKNISHALSYDDALERGRKSSKIFYVKNQSVFHGVTIFTDECLGSVDSVQSKFKVAWIMEPRSYAPNCYQVLEAMIDKFDMILTHDSQILHQYPEISKRIPADGIFLDSASIFQKTEKSRLCSMLYSEKTMLEGHRLRHTIANLIKENNIQVDMLGSGTGTRLDKKSDALNRYCFSIVVENSIDQYYITEKIFDCFATRTIPIYWGTDQVLHEFNADGIMVFKTLHELMHILETISLQSYNQKTSAIDDNYRLVMKHYSVDDHVADAINELLKF